MDLSLLPSRLNEYCGQDRGVHFTVRSASSSSYQLPNRQTLQRQTRLCTEQTDQADDEKTQGKSDEGFQADTNGTLFRTSKQPSLRSRVEGLSGPDMSERTGTGDELSPDRSGHLHMATGTRGRTDWMRTRLNTRSQSLDWRGGATRTGLLGPSKNLGASTLKRAESLESKGPEDRERGGRGDRPGNPSGTKRLWGRTGASHSHVTQPLDGTSGSQSFPARLRGPAGSDASGPTLREKASSMGTKAGQSISARIEKLYGSTESDRTEESTRAKRLSAPVENWLPEGAEEVASSAALRRRGSTDSAFTSPSSSTSLSPSSPSSSPLFPLGQPQEVSSEGKTWGTFPRRFSRGETNSLSVLQGGPRSPRASQTDPAISVEASGPAGASSVSSSNRDLATGAQEVLPEQGKLWRRGAVTEVGTRSLDRSRGKFTVASQIRSDRAAGGGHAAAHTLSHRLVEEVAVAPPRDPDGRVGKDGVKGHEGLSNSGAGQSSGRDTSDQTRERLGSPSLRLDLERRSDPNQVKGVTEADKGTLDGTKSQPMSPLNSSSPKTALPNRKFPDRLVVPSAASVRNKIHQFEVLSQRAQGTAAPGQYQKPRRAFSVPEVLSGAGNGILRSGSDKGLAGLRGKWEGLRKIEEGGRGGEEGKGTGEEWVKSGAEKGGRIGPDVEKGKAQRGWNMRSVSVDEVGLRLNERDRLGTSDDRMEQPRGGDISGTDPYYYSKLKGQLKIPLNSRSKMAPYRDLDETDFSKAPEVSQRGSKNMDRNVDTASPAFNSNNNNDGGLKHSLSGVPCSPRSELSSLASDEDRTPTNTPHNSPLYPSQPLAGESFGIVTPPFPLNTSSVVLPGPISTSSPSRVPQTGLIIPQLKGEKRGEDLDVWVAGLNQKIEGWNDEVFDDDDDEGTEKDEDSNYDSDESSVTITSNMSQSDKRSFSLSLADLCNFGGVDYESSSDSDEWSVGRRSASLSSDVSALSCVSVLASEELDRLLDDVRSLGDNTLQNYEDIQVVVLHKEVGAGLGFTLAGGVDQNKPVTVHKVFPSGVAAQEGSIMAGDKVLSINGTALCDSTHGEALRTLRRARNQGMGVVVLKRGGFRGPRSVGVENNTPGGTPQPTESIHTRVCVRLEKGSRDLGFSLEGGVGSNLGDRAISVQKIFLGGPVSEVFPGDEVIEINGVSVVGMRRLEAWTLIRKLPPGPVEVVLHRPLKT